MPRPLPSPDPDERKDRMVHKPTNDDDIETVAGIPETSEAPLPPLLKFLLEMGPLIVFFFANARSEQLGALFPTLANLGGPIFVATALFMGATVISLVVSYALTRTLPLVPLVSGAIVLVFGGLTLWLQNDLFIKLKPTILNSLFGATLLIGLALGHALLKPVFGVGFTMDDEGWRKLSFRWGLFFLFLAVLNEFVWRTQSDDFWVAFKVWGMFPITVLFTLSQMPLIMRHTVEE